MLLLETDTISMIWKNIHAKHCQHFTFCTEIYYCPPCFVIFVSRLTNESNIGLFDQHMSQKINSVVHFLSENNNSLLCYNKQILRAAIFTVFIHHDLVFGHVLMNDIVGSYLGILIVLIMIGFFLIFKIFYMLFYVVFSY